jgi:hypothetical protein
MLKKKNQLYILSDGSCFINPMLSLKNQSKYFIFNQDFNNNIFWMENVHNETLNNKSRLLDFKEKYLNKK